MFISSIIRTFLLLTLEDCLAWKVFSFKILFILYTMQFSMYYSILFFLELIFALLCEKSFAPSFGYSSCHSLFPFGHILIRSLTQLQLG